MENWLSMGNEGIAIVGLFGLILGSFLNVCILRIPEGTFFQSHRSNCPQCKKTIPFYLNIPVLSFLLLAGKSKCCGQKISSLYPIVEIMTALTFIIAWKSFPFLQITENSFYAWDQQMFIRFAHASILCSLLIVCATIDFRLMIIPDVISLPMIILSPLIAWVHPDLTFIDSIYGMLLGSGILYGISWIYWFVRKEVGLGLGDVKLLAAIGGWMGVSAVLPTVFWGSILGSFFGVGQLLINRKNRNWQSPIPFGPFLVIGTIIYLFWGFHLF